jgi:DNA-binding NtrC family response regulator
VRELENLVERAVILSESDVLTCDDLLDMMPFVEEPASEPPRRDERLSIEGYIREFIVQNQDRHTETELAAMLGMGRKALWMRRRRWGLYRDAHKGSTADPAGPAD